MKIYNQKCSVQENALKIETQPYCAGLHVDCHELRTVLLKVLQCSIIQLKNTHICSHTNTHTFTILWLRHYKLNVWEQAGGFKSISTVKSNY